MKSLLNLDPNVLLVKHELRKALMGCKTVLDVGCGTSITLRELKVGHCVGIEGYRPTFEEAQRLKTHDELIFGDIRILSKLFTGGQFDACVALDVIEHLPKDEGVKLIQDMELIAQKKVVFFTPNGFLPQKQSDASDLQAHFSGWEAKEMREHGYTVLGMLGPKSLRGEYHRLKHRPKVFWSLVSTGDQILRIRRHPEKAAAILCIKSLPGQPKPINP